MIPHYRKAVFKRKTLDLQVEKLPHQREMVGKIFLYLEQDHRRDILARSVKGPYPFQRRIWDLASQHL